MQIKILKTNIGKRKVMVSEKNCSDVQRTGKCPCMACGKGVGIKPGQCIWMGLQELLRCERFTKYNWRR